MKAYKKYSQSILSPLLTIAVSVKLCSTAHMQFRMTKFEIHNNFWYNNFWQKWTKVAFHY